MMLSLVKFQVVDCDEFFNFIIGINQNKKMSLWLSINDKHRGSDNVV